MAEYTPGPWAKGIRSNQVAIAGGCGEWIALLPNGRREGFGVVSDDEIIANARLIAAAPELFEQLVWAETVLKCFIEGSAQLESLRAAIAKATDGEG